MKVSQYLRTKKSRRKSVMLSVYDQPTALLADEAGADMVLVGDSVATVVLGYPSTREVTMDEMIHHARAVRRGVKRALLIGDLPLKGVEKGPAQAVASARRFMKEAGCEAVKLEWTKDAPAILSAFKKNRIPVMIHVGLTPQTVGEYRVQGARADDAVRIFRQTRLAEEKGAFGALLECVPEPLAEVVTRSLGIPTVGIGSGRFCDGQVLVFHDVAGMNRDFRARFVRRYANLYPQMQKAAASFVRDTASGRYPQKKHAFAMRPDEFSTFKAALRAGGEKIR